jgi:hypothetical protein
MRDGKINLAFGFAATKPGEYHAFLVTHQPSGSRAKEISVNRFANYSPSVDLEIESSILRGLVPLAPVVPPLSTPIPAPAPAPEGHDIIDTVRMPQPLPQTSEAV